MNQDRTTSRRGRGRGAAAMAAAAVAIVCGAAATRAAAASDPGITCSAGKKKAAMKRYDGELKCHISAMQRGTAVDPACLAKAQAKFDAAFAKAESKGGCATVGDTAGIGALIDGQLAALNAALPWVNEFVCDVGVPGDVACNTCVNCTFDPGKPCADAYAACQGEADCVAFWDCITPCTDNACVQSCVINHNYGAGLYSAMVSCAIGKCPTTCNP